MYINFYLLNRSCAFAQETKLVFTLFNQNQRHKTSSVVSVTAKNNPILLKKLGITLKCPEFKTNLEKSIQNPNGKEAKLTLKLIDSLLNVNGGKIIGSPAERKTAISTIISMVQFYGCPSIFFTFAPDDIHSVLTLRMSCPTMHGNNAFPAVDCGFEKFLQEKNFTPHITNIMDDSINISELNLHNLLSKNPVAAAHIFKITLETITPDYLSKITLPLSGRCKGIFGHTKAAYTVTEVQGRLSLHGHLTIWSVLSPEVIQNSIQCYKLVDSIKEVILSQISSSIPLKFHVDALNRQATPPSYRSPNVPPRAFFDSPLPEENKNNFENHVYNVVNTTAVHQHSLTCVKGNLGHKGCRLSYPSNCTNGKGVTIIQLKVNHTENIDEKKSVTKNNQKDICTNNIDPQNLLLNVKDNKKEIEYYEIKYEKIKFVNFENNYIIKHKPLGTSDNKCIILEIQKEHSTLIEINNILKSCQYNNFSFLNNLDDESKRNTFKVISHRNGGVVNYSPTASAALRCNTAAYHLGGNDQAKSTLFYLIKYITKDALSPTTSLALIAYARSKVDAYPSIAHDTGTDIRTGQHLLTVMLNKSRSCKEIADTQAALSLLNMPAQFGTIKNSYIFIKDACRLIKERITVKENHDNNKNKNKKSLTCTNKNKLLQSSLIEKDNLSYTKIHKFDAFKNIHEDKNENLSKHEISTQCPGTSIFYEIHTNKSNSVIPVSQDIHYAYRGKNLEELSLFEYASIIEIVRIQNNKSSKSIKIVGKRKNNTTFAFQEMHPLHSTHCQRIRSKLLIPILVGGAPLNFNSIDDNNADHIYENCSYTEKKSLNKAALYYLTLTSPWTLQLMKERQVHELIPQGGHTYKDFVEYMKMLKGYNSSSNTYNSSFLNRCLYSYIVDTSRNMKAKIQNKIMSAKHRGRTADEWEKNHNGPSKYPKEISVCQSINYWRHKHNIANLPNRDIIITSNENFDINDPETNELINSIKNDCSNMNGDTVVSNEAINRYLQNSFDSLTQMTTDYSSKVDILNKFMSSKLSEEVWNNIREKILQDDSDQMELHNSSLLEIYTRASNISNIMIPNLITPNMTPTNDQLKVLQVLKSYLQEFQDKQFLLFIHGGPGVGKTWTINEFKNMLREKRLKFLCTAYTGVAASLLNGGETIHSLFQFYIGKNNICHSNSTLSDIALRTMHEKIKDCNYIIIDEISMVGSSMLCKIHHRLQELTGNDLPFGGKNILALGDFFQIIPVGDSCLYKDIIKYIVLEKEEKDKKLNITGAALFSKFKLLTLDDQVRAAEDKQQMETLSSLRSFNGNQVSSNLLQSLIQNNTLNKEDFKESQNIDSYNNWATAPLAVTSNCERDHLMFIRAQIWAKIMGQPIITWNIQCRGTLFNYLTESYSIKEIFHNQSGLIGIFVQGAMSYITENINPAKGLANGTTVYMHSLSFSEKDMQTNDYNIFLSELQVFSPGQQIHISKIIPLFINVEFKLTNELVPYWKITDTLCTDKNIIPIGYKSRSETITMNININNKMYNNVKIIKEKEHRVELSYIITFHKLQGKTLPKLIIQLNERPFLPHLTYNGLLVALSRVKLRKDLRILPITSGTDLQYLKKLSPDPNLQIWLRGYDSNGIWSKNKSKEFSDHIKIVNNSNKKIASRQIKKNLENNIKQNEHKIKNTIPTYFRNEELHINTTNIKRSIIDLSDSITDSSKENINFSTNQLQVSWRSTCNKFSNMVTPINDSERRKVWQIDNNEIQLTEEYMILATNMFNAGFINSFMPDSIQRFTHQPSDVLSLRKKEWLTGTIISTFLSCMILNVNDGTINYSTNILNHTFYTTLTNTSYDDASDPQWNTYDYNQVQNYTDHYTTENILKNFIIPIHVPSHWLLCIIDPPMKTIYIIDSLRHNNSNVLKNIQTWYKSELQRFNYDTSVNSEYDILTWHIINENNLPSYVPVQNDSTSCGIFLVIFAFYWYTFHRLPNSYTDWNARDIDLSVPNLRQFVLHFIIKTINNENNRLSDLSND